MDAEMLRFLKLNGTELLEAQVLGCLLLRSGDGLRQVDLSEDDFAIEAHRDIYRTIADLVEAGDPAGNVEVYSRLKKHGERVAACLMTVPTGANLVWYLKELKVDIFRRAEADARLEASRRIKAGEPHDDVFSDTSSRIQSLRQRYLADEKATPLDHAANQMFHRIRERQPADAVLLTGIPWFDRLTHGLAEGENCILAARPGCGKTDMLLNILVKLARAEVKTCFFSLEMSAQQLVERISSIITQDDCTLIMRRPECVGEMQRTSILARQNEIMAVMRYIETHFERVSTIQEISALSRKAVLSGAKMLAVDYLQLISQDGRNRNEEVERISRAWKALLKELRVPGIMLSQLNRSGEHENRPPRLSDLRDSGSVEQDADFVWFIHRQKDRAGNDGQTVFVQEKARQVERGRRFIKHSGASHTFLEVEHAY